MPHCLRSQLMITPNRYAIKLVSGFGYSTGLTSGCDMLSSIRSLTTQPKVFVEAYSMRVVSNTSAGRRSWFSVPTSAWKHAHSVNRSNLFISLLTPTLTKMFSHTEDTPKNQHELKLELNQYERVCNETLENLSEVLDKLLEECYMDEFDVSLANGVLTVQLSHHGTYVINKQTPNRQIWLSSPFTGPKRYDLVQSRWIYSHDNESLDDLLSREFTKVLCKPVHIKLS